MEHSTAVELRDALSGLRLPSAVTGLDDLTLGAAERLCVRDPDAWYVEVDAETRQARLRLLDGLLLREFQGGGQDVGAFGRETVLRCDYRIVELAEDAEFLGCQIEETQYSDPARNERPEMRQTWRFKLTREEPIFEIVIEESSSPGHRQPFAVALAEAITRARRSEPGTSSAR